MRRGLLWMLAVTVVLSAVALWVADGPAKVVAALDRTGAAALSLAEPRTPVDPAQPLPQQIASMTLEPAQRDIFAPVEPPASKVAATPPETAPAPEPPPAPSAPAMTWRYLGSMLTPSGQRLVMLARGETNVTIEAGTVLEDGYVVQAIGADAVRLVYPPLGTVVDVPIPAATPSSR